MHRIDTPGAGVGGVWITGNPITGIPSTIIGADFLNAAQEEIARVIEAEGFALDKSDNGQLRRAIESMIDGVAGGLTTGDRAGLDAITPGPVGAPRVHELWSASRWQVNRARSGWRISNIDGGASYTPIAGGTIPARYLAEGGEIEILATGVLTPGSINPGLAIQLYIGSELIRPEGAQGAAGWLLLNGTIGQNLLVRLPSAGARWTLRLRVTSLGADTQTQAGETSNGNPGQLLTEGTIVVDVVFTKGDGWQPKGMAGASGDWIVATSYALDDRVVHHGQGYVCIAGHTSAAADEPGGGADWRVFWIPRQIVFQIRGVHELPDIGDDELEQKIELRVGAPTHFDAESVGAWATATGYIELDVRTNGGTPDYWLCTQGHTSGASDEPGVGADAPQFWVQIAKGGNDFVHVDYTRAILFGGVPGREWSEG